MVVSISHAVVDEDAVVIEFRDAGFANAAVFGAGGFEEVASVTGVAGVEYRKVVRIERHGLVVCFWGDVTRISVCCKIEKQVGEKDGYGGFDPEGGVHEFQSGRYERDF